MRDYFFIVGSGRSGTTLLSVILDRHTRLCVTPETAFFDEVAPSLVGADDDGLIEVLSSWRRLPELDLEPEVVRQKIGAPPWGTADVLAAILDLYALRRGKIRCGEKTPQHLVHVPEILRCFPKAKVICVLRDGRDVALSLSKMPWWQTRGLTAAAEWWQQCVRLMEEFASEYPENFRFLRYEELLLHPEETLSRIMKYLGERFEPAQLQTDISSHVVLLRSVDWKGKALQPIDPGCIGHRRAEAGREELAFLERFLYSDLRRHGYELETSVLMNATSSTKSESAICDLGFLELLTEPFPHVTHDHFIQPDHYRSLAESFPTCPSSIGPTGFSLYWGDDEYQRLLNERREWQLLFNSFHSQQFIDWCATQFAEVWQREGCTIDVSQAKYIAYREDRVDKERATLRTIEHQPHELWVRMDIHQGRLGYSRPVHLDHARRLMSMLVYMCDHTENEMTGGELFLHTNEKSDSPQVKRITPQHNLMVAFPCGRRSHHSVPPITAIGAPRNYIQVHISSSVDIWSPVTRPASKPLRSQRSHSHASVTGKNDLEASRLTLLSALAGETDITLIRPYGNMGDHLIHAGTRRLLSNIAYKEVSLLHLDGVRGQVAVIMGGGGWCKAHSDLPRYLPHIEAQFERVIVFPSSFDITEASVKEALSKSKALFFARERKSYEQIRGLCQADLAHDCALFFDFGQYQQTGRGLLTAYRTDAEAVGHPLPPGNNDISMTCESLDEFLSTIARYETIETDRAHVMIAAAQLGKRVYYNTSNYHKVPALAKFNLADYPLTRLFESRTAVIREQLLLRAREYEGKLPANFVESHQAREVTVVMLSHGRIKQTLNAIRALQEHVHIPFELLLVDNDSDDQVRSALVDLSQSDERIQLELLRENLGCTGGRNYAASRVTTPYVLLIDNDMEVMPGALEHLLYQLEQHPKAVAVMGNVIFPDGSIHVCGGGPLGELLAKNRRFDEPIGESGPCDWVTGGFTLIRAAVFAEHPFDPNMRHYFEDFEWCHRINQAQAGEFYRVVEALAIHFHENKSPDQLRPKEEKRKQAMKYVETLAYFYRKHGFVYDALFYHVPELGDATNPFSVASAKILLELVNSLGSEWVLSRWNREELAPLFAANSLSPEPVNQLGDLPFNKLNDLQRTIHARDEAISWLREKWTESQETISARDEAIAWLRSRLEE